MGCYKVNLKEFFKEITHVFRVYGLKNGLYRLKSKERKKVRKTKEVHG